MRLKYFRLVGLITISVFLFGCSSPEETTRQSTFTATRTPVRSTPTPRFTATPIPRLEAPVYNLELLLDYDQKHAEVKEDILYQNQAGEPLTSITLAVEPNLWPDCFTLREILLDDQPVQAYSLEGQRLDVPVSLDPLETLTISLSYSLSLPEINVNDQAVIIRSQVFGYTLRQLNLVDWYPFVVPYEPGNGWLLHDPATYGEHLVYDSVDFKVVVTFTGKTVPVVAASGFEFDSSIGKTYQLVKGRSFALSFSPGYLVKSGAVDGITVNSYYFQGSELAAQAALQATLNSLQLFNQVFSTYPHSSLSIVQEETAFSMEYDGLFFLERPLYFGYSGADTDFLPTIAAHETAHQWWFGLVGTDQAEEPWLDEALSTYSERLFNESISLEKGNWWYLARLSLAEKKDCPVDISIYGFYDFNCYYTESVYMRGGLFLQALRDRLGDQVFLEFLSDFARQFAHQHATSSDFFLVLQQHSDTDLNDIIADFFQGSY